MENPNKKAIIDLLQRGVICERDADAIRQVLMENDDFKNALLFISEAAKDFEINEGFNESDLARLLKKYRHLIPA